MSKFRKIFKKNIEVGICFLEKLRVWAPIPDYAFLQFIQCCYLHNNGISWSELD